MTRCRLHPHDAAAGATHRRYTGIKCRRPSGQARDRIAVCQHAHVSSPPRRGWRWGTRPRLLAALTARAQTTAAVAERARLPLDVAYSALWHAHRVGAVAHSPPRRPGDCARWRLP